MRRHILANIDQAGYHIGEIPVTVETLKNSDEIFLTNVIRGIQPVTHFADKEFATNLSRNIFNILVKPLTQD
jgi:branched-chain amino acid aminotransferase